MSISKSARKIVRISDYYQLKRTQDELDFVDVDIAGDSRVFIDPSALQRLPSAWGQDCVSLVQNFFQHVLDNIRNKRNNRALSLLKGLSEPNETHLGWSSGKARGHGIGKGYARDVWQALLSSEAIKTGLLSDLEDTILFIPGIGIDLISDMTTNIIRGLLLSYTKDACEYYDIPTKQVDSGPIWNSDDGKWFNSYVPLPRTHYSKLLLVPKLIVRQKADYDAGEYFNDYVLTFLQKEEIRVNGDLVQLLKNGKVRVTKKDLMEKYGVGKDAITRLTQKYPQILDQYKEAKDKNSQPPLTHDQFAEALHTSAPNWDQLLQDVLSTPQGRDAAHIYENNVEKLLTSLFYPNLTSPKKQQRTHEGRKRIDITYTNNSTMGFFNWLATNYPAMFVHVECKNYNDDPANPELDQMAGRFSRGRGKFGIIVCRSISDKVTFAKRCRDTANDDRGFIITMDDQDLQTFVAAQKSGGQAEVSELLFNKFNPLVM